MTTSPVLRTSGQFSAHALTTLEGDLFLELGELTELVRRGVDVPVVLESAAALAARRSFVPGAEELLARAARVLSGAPRDVQLAL